MTSTIALNNVNLTAVGNLVAAIQKSPEKARVDRQASEATPDAIAALHQRVAATSPVGHTLANAVSVKISAS